MQWKTKAIHSNHFRFPPCIDRVSNQMCVKKKEINWVYRGERDKDIKHQLRVKSRKKNFFEIVNLKQKTK